MVRRQIFCRSHFDLTKIKNADNLKLISEQIVGLTISILNAINIITRLQLKKNMIFNKTNWFNIYHV